MAEYKLSLEAKNDIKRIYFRGFDDFGEAQADEYFMQFFAKFDQIASEPYLYPLVDHIKAGYRRSVCGVDSIYYRIVDGKVEIMRILGRQDLINELDEK